jgi:hypothetical protein
MIAITGSPAAAGRPPLNGRRAPVSLIEDIAHENTGV